MLPVIDTVAPPVDLLIVGAGFGGLYMLHRARQKGLTALVICLLYTSDAADE